MDQDQDLIIWEGHHNRTFTVPTQHETTYSGHWSQ
jgi:hypothetical protein